jgi:hypothetical protein
VDVHVRGARKLHLELVHTITRPDRMSMSVDEAGDDSVVVVFKTLCEGRKAILGHDLFLSSNSHDKTIITDNDGTVVDNMELVHVLLALLEQLSICANADHLSGSDERFVRSHLSGGAQRMIGKSDELLRGISFQSIYL